MAIASRSAAIDIGARFPRTFIYLFANDSYLKIIEIHN
jgi:hypothetical protein